MNFREALYDIARLKKADLINEKEEKKAWNDITAAFEAEPDGGIDEEVAQFLKREVEFAASMGNFEVSRLKCPFPLRYAGRDIATVTEEDVKVFAEVHNLDFEKYRSFVGHEWMRLSFEKK